ncbi:immunity 22 family protein [Cerasicoccus frondis]|uniref:immunity 22 family protein n=1 Tax=Cerasicoccus frondis TaxID=490090 RepID=UPI0028529A1A|nr:immunity 22 family protein [Cerasicoccus frondis]
MAKRIRSQFWICKFSDGNRCKEFFKEDESYFDEENEDNDELPLSEFIASQGETWFDHDFFEFGFSSKESSSLEKMFVGHSWVEKWAPIVEEKLRELGIADYNSFAMMGIDHQPKFGEHRQVSNPRSFLASGVELVYLGEISHEW